MLSVLMIKLLTYRSQEACKLLTVLPGSAKLVKELLLAVEQQQGRSDDNSYDMAVPLTKINSDWETAVF